MDIPRTYPVNPGDNRINATQASPADEVTMVIRSYMNPLPSPLWDRTHATIDANRPSQYQK